MGLPPLSPSSIVLNENIDDDLPNSIERVQNYDSSQCQGQKVRFVLQRRNCEDVTIDSITCGGMCSTNVPTSPANSTSELLSGRRCSTCGAVEWKERLVHFLCYSKKRRRRIKFEEKKVVEVKKCACVREYCHKQNSVPPSHGGNEWPTCTSPTENEKRQLRCRSKNIE